jgi:hypothetical protein
MCEQGKRLRIHTAASDREQGKMFIYPHLCGLETGEKLFSWIDLKDKIPT